MMNSDPKKLVNILLIEDDPDDAFLVKDLLGEARFLDFQFHVVHSYREGLEIVSLNQHDVYLVDHHLGAEKGVELIRKAREAGIKKPIILLTGLDSPQVDQEAQDVGASDYILKSQLDTALLERAIRYGISQWQASEAQESLITEQLLREEAESREAQWHLLSETIPYGLWLTNPSGQVEYISKSFLQLINITYMQPLNLTFQELLPKHLRAKWQKSLMEGRRWNEEMKITNLDGEIVYILSRGVPIKDEEGNIEQWVGINLDITREKKLDQRKDEFLRIASHEFKSPIMSILSSLYILEDEIKGGKIETSGEYIVRMKRQLKNLTQLVEDLLDLSKIEMQKLSYHPEIFDLNELIVEVAEDLRSSTDHEIKLKMPDDIYIEADRQRLRQVLVNLISNAIKYSPDAKEVNLKVEENGEKLRIDIIDHGIGISDNDIGKVFGKFYASTDTATKKMGGLGLGLFLSKKIIELHQGEITVASKRGKGSTFTVRIPKKQSV